MAVRYDELPSMRRGIKFFVRYAARLRREGGSLSLTMPRYIVRQWRLKAGDNLLVRSTEEGILLSPRFPSVGISPEYTRTRSGERRQPQP